MKAIKPVITGPEQSMSEPAQWGGGLKSPALVVLETTRYPTQRKNSPFENNQIQSSGKRGVSNPKRGYRRGYKLAFDFAKPSIHAGFKPSFKRFHLKPNLVPAGATPIIRDRYEYRSCLRPYLLP